MLEATPLRLLPARELKLAPGDVDTGVFRGYASTFGPPADAYGDIIEAGAFAKSLLSHQDAGQMPALLWQHAPADPIGVWQNISEDAHGLVVEGKLTPGVQRADEAIALMKTGVPLALSIGFRTIRDRLDRKTGVRHLEEAELVEISLVTFPANPRAKITELRTIREFEAAVRDGLGLSSREAKRLAAGGWSALQERDVPDASEAKELVRHIRGRAKELTRI